MTFAQPAQYREDRRLFLAAASFFVAVYLAWLLWGSDSPWERFWIGNLSILASSAGAAAFAWWAMKTAASEASPAWRLLAAGLTLWAAVDGLRMILLAAAPEMLFQLSLLDGLYLLGALALAGGLLRYPRPGRQNISRTRQVLDVALTLIGLAALVYLLVLQSWLASPRGEGNPAAILYPLGDLGLLLILAVLFLLSDVHQRGMPFSWIAIGMLLLALSDLLYAYSLAQATYQTGSVTDLGWVMGNLFLVMAGLSQSRWGVVWHERFLGFITTSLRRLQSLLPILTTLLLGWFVILDWRLNEIFHPVSLAIVLLLAVGLIGRQGLLTGEVEFEQYANLVRSVAEPAFVCDGRGRLALVNPALVQISGYASAASLLGQPLDVLIDPAEDAARLVGLGRRPAPDGGDAGWSGEVALRRSDHSLLPVFLSLRPVLSSTSERFALAGTAHDLSLQKRQQAALQAAYQQIAADHAELERLNSQLEHRVDEKTADLSQAYAQLEAQNQALLQLDRLKSDFVSLVSHELRAPLTNIKSGIELLLYSTRPLSGRSSQILELVQAEIQRLTRFVETILDISALDAGRLPLYPAPLSLGAVIRVLQNQIAHLPGAERVAWRTPADLPSLVADEQALTSVLFHLLDNAFKYAPEGTVEVSAGTARRRVWIKVSDRGPGLPKESLPNLFERFYRSNSEDDQVVYGHGLGLYIVRRLVEAMQGEITAENRRGGGACFTCWLPAADEPEGTTGGETVEQRRVP